MSDCHCSLVFRHPALRPEKGTAADLETIARLTARNEELAPIILEEENVEIVAAVRARYMGLAEFERDFKGRQDGGVPFLMSETTNEQEDMQHEA